MLLSCALKRCIRVWQMVIVVCVWSFVVRGPLCCPYVYYSRLRHHYKAQLCKSLHPLKSLLLIGTFITGFVVLMKKRGKFENLRKLRLVIKLQLWINLIEALNICPMKSHLHAICINGELIWLYCPPSSPLQLVYHAFHLQCWYLSFSLL